MEKYYSTSQISAYRQCRQKWVYSYQHRLKSRAPQRPLYVGSTIHKLLEVRANGGDWRKHLYEVVKPEFEAMPQAHQDVLGEDFIDSLDKIMSQYEWVYHDENVKYLATEVKIESKIDEDKFFVGVVDAICEIDGDQYIMEHKTFKTTKMSFEQTWLNQQACLYIRELNNRGYNIKGVIWDMIKTQPYKPPRVLKNGSFGKQYGEQTLLSFFDLGIHQEEIPEAVYEEVKGNHLNFVDRYIVPIVPTAVEAVWQDFLETVYEIAQNQGCAKNLGRECDWCAFKELCQAELTGGDVEYTKQLLYTTPAQREKEILEQFKETPECVGCQMLAISNGYKVDFEQCALYCEKYRKFKEDKQNG